MAFKRVIIRRVGPLSWLLEPMSAFLLTVVLSTASPISLGPEWSKELYDQPCNSSSIADFEVAVCQYQRYRRADLELNKVFKQLLSQYAKSTDKETENSNKEHRESIVSAQKSWVIFRDKDCYAIGMEWEGGHGRPGTEFSCLADHTEQRIIQLRSHGL
jgi:uncharacterized protein YecT (DUF1311 family)